MVLTDRSKLSIVRAMSPGPEKSFDRDVVLEEAMLLGEVEAHHLRRVSSP